MKLLEYDSGVYRNCKDPKRASCASLPNCKYKLESQGGITLWRFTNSLSLWGKIRRIEVYSWYRVCFLKDVELYACKYLNVEIARAGYL